MRLLFLISLFFSFALPSFCSEEIQIHLPTAPSLETIYIAKLQAQNTPFTTHYLHELDQVLLFDFQHNGATTIEMRSPEKESHFLSKPSFQPGFWQHLKVAYVLFCQIDDRNLNATVLDTKTGHLQTFKHIPLTGNLNQDRRQIHKLADTIHASVFQKPGIATARLLFSYQTKNLSNAKETWVSEIWECDYDGANLRQITYDNSYCVTPVAIPALPSHHNDHFLYVSYKMGQPKIYLGNRKGGTGKRLIDLSGNQLLPAISLQRDKIAFICDISGRTDLFLQTFHPKTQELGKPMQLYSHPRSTQASPTFSPNGSKIAFVSDKDGGMRIYTIPTIIQEKRAVATLITKQNRENSCPSWSPDGTKLAYSAKTNGIRQIWIYDFTTQEEWQLTSGPGHKENPTWGKNSCHLVFNSSDGQNSELYLVNLNQKDAVKISHGPGKKQYPAWVYQ